MSIKWIGAILIICSCGLVGFKISKAYRMEEQNLRQLLGALDYMVCELQTKRIAGYLFSNRDRTKGMYWKTIRESI